MKNFVKENWYKLMIGSSMMMASFGFMIYSISPSYSNSNSNSNSNEKELKSTSKSPNYTGSEVFIEANGYIVLWDDKHELFNWVEGSNLSYYAPKIRKLP